MSGAGPALPELDSAPAPPLRGDTSQVLSHLAVFLGAGNWGWCVGPDNGEMLKMNLKMRKGQNGPNEIRVHLLSSPGAVRWGLLLDEAMAGG